MKRLHILTSFIVAMFVFIACREEKKVVMSGEDPVEIRDFVDFFPELKPGFQLTDDELHEKSNDSLLISKTVFSQLVPDSILQKYYRRHEKPRFYPVGKLIVSDDETFLIVKANLGIKNKSLIVFLGRDNEFITMLPFLEPDKDPATKQVSSIDKRFSISKTVLKKNADESISEGRDVFVFDPESRSMILIMTDALDEKDVELINPIDTLPRENKFSADYAKNSKNIVSVRDGRKPGMITFFIHIEKNNGDCTGELKGEASFVNDHTAVYRQYGDPCSLELSFTNSTVTLREKEGCGLHHGLNCKFEGQFAKKKNPLNK